MPGGLLIVGGCLAILPVLELWMLPLSVVLLAETVRPLRRLTRARLDRRRHPGWLTCTRMRRAA